MKSSPKNSQRNKHRARSPVKESTGGSARSPLGWLPPLVIFLATIAAFYPVLQNGFVNWDDDKNIYENLNYRGLGWSPLRWMFTTLHMGHYQPLTWMSLAVDYRLWGMDPFGYHLTSLMLHAANGVVFYFIALRLLSLIDGIAVVSRGWSRRAGAGLAALLFAIHPLRVESVAWATERRDLLSGFFLLCAVLCYLRANGGREANRLGHWWMIGAGVSYGASLLSKAAGVSLPVVLLVLDIYPLKRLGSSSGWWTQAARRVWKEKVPFIIMAVAAGVVASVAQHQTGAMKYLADYGVFPRILQALFGLAFYLWKTIIPVGLSPLYETPAILDSLVPALVVSAVLVLALTIILVMLRRRWPAGLAVWVCYLAFIAPVSGLVQSGPQFVADRYSYLACLGWAVLGVGGLFCFLRYWAGEKIAPRLLVGIGVLAVTVLSALAVLTWQQTLVWRDSQSVWRQVLRIDPKSSIAWNNLGNVLLERGEVKEAIEHYKKALEIKPDYADAHFDLAVAFNEAGQLQAAVEQFQRGLEFDPQNAKARHLLGVAHARLGEIGKAVEEFRRSLTLSPGQSMVHFDLGTALVIQGRLDEAVDHFRQAIAIQPDFAKAHDRLGRVLAAQDRLSEAIQEFTEAVRFAPEFVQAHEDLGRALAQQGNKEEAARHYQEALRIMKSRRPTSGTP
jgi:tetratricopeptide (TPR) repeat protein